MYAGDGSNTGLDNSWLIRMNYTATEWEMLTRKTQFVIGSTNKLRFTNLINETFSSETQKSLRDNVKILKINPRVLQIPTSHWGTDYKFNAFGYFTYNDGYSDPIM